jgi:hypothetical protein
MKIEVNIPDYFDNFKYNEHDIKMMIGVMLYEKRVLDSGFSAEAIGVSKYEFIRDMGKYGKSIIDISVKDFERELDNAKKQRI